MNELLPHRIHCPYCGEAQGVLVDGSVEQQKYIEDCQVCCRPIILTVTQESDGRWVVLAAHENE